MNVVDKVLAKIMTPLIAWYERRLKSKAFDKEAYFHEAYEKVLEEALTYAKLYSLAKVQRDRANARADGGNRVVAGTYLGGK